MVVLDFFALIGGAFLAIKLISWAYQSLTKPKFTLDELKYGWVVITGSTDGIGLAYANEFARRGFNLVLVSRNPDKLKAVQTQLINQFKVQVETVQVDFGKSHINTEALLEYLTSELSKFEVSLLINNVGCISKGIFKDYTWEQIEQMVSTNLYPIVLMTYSILPRMISRFDKSGQRSLILNLSSSTAYFAMDQLSVYSATKRFVLNFSKSLSYEVENRGILVSTITPGTVDTALARVLHGPTQSSISISSDAFVEASLAQIYKKETIGHPKHTFLISVFKLLPLEWRSRIASFLSKN